MAINFPDTPATNDTYLAPNGIEYIYTGTKWRPFKPSEPTIGTITASSQLNLSAGGANQNVVISPSGSGIVSIPSSVSITGNTTLSSSLSMYNATSSNISITGDSSTSIVLARSSTDATGSSLNFRKYRGTTASPTIVSTGDVLGNSNYTAWDGTQLVAASRIQGIAEIVNGVDDIGGALTFSTRPEGTLAVLAERMRIDSQGFVGINTASPISALDVNGAVTANRLRAYGTSETAGLPGFSWDNDASTGFFRKGAGSIGITVSGTEELNITAAGTFELSATSGYSQTMSEWAFRRTTNGAAIGPAAADVFTSPSSVALEASSVYEIEGMVYFLKTTAGTVTWNPVFSAAPTFSMIEYTQSPVTGLAANGGTTLVSISGTGYTQGTATTVAVLASATNLTTAVNHFFRFRTYVRTNTACNWRLRATSSAGTITPLAGSYYSIRKVAVSTGTFAA